LTLILTKGVGPAALGGRDLPVAATKIFELLAPAILAALIVVGTFTGPDGAVVLDARAAGLVTAAAVYVISRGSILTAVASAAIVAALARLLGAA
jgi:branched-subunit amino acid transport protein